MCDLLTDAAEKWAIEAIKRHSDGVFGKIESGIIWADTRDDAGTLLVSANPGQLVSEINNTPYPVLHNHDPGKPKGQLIEAKAFKTEDDREFVIGILGFHANGKILNFHDFPFCKSRLSFVSYLRCTDGIPNHSCNSQI